MAVTSFIPNAGRLPVLGALPVLLRQPVQLLANMPGVESVVSNADASGTIIYVMFEWEKGKYTEALKCFRGLKPKRIQVNKEYHYLMVSV